MRWSIVVLRAGVAAVITLAAALVATGSSGIAAATAGAAAGGVVLLARRSARRQRQRHTRALRASLPDAIDLLAAAIDGGVAPGFALARVARFTPDPLGRELSEATRDAVDGLGIGVRAIDPALRPLGALLRQSEELGVPIAGALRLLAADARERRRFELREQAAAAAPKMLLVVGALLAPASLLVVIGGQVLVLRDLAGGFGT